MSHPPYNHLFQAIGIACLQLATAGDYAATAKALRGQIDASFYTDPTAAMRYLQKRDGIETQLKLLDAAAAFLSTTTAALGPDHPDTLLIRAAQDHF